MIHLFNKVYISHESMYNSSAESILLVSEKKNHPINELYGIKVGNILAFEDVLKVKFKDQIENFWFDAFYKDSSMRYNIFADYNLFNRLLIQYWKSIFKTPDPLKLYDLYKLFILSMRLKTYLFNDYTPQSRAKFLQCMQPLPQDEFIQLFDNTVVVDFLKTSDKGSISFEYLMADYYYNQQSPYAHLFLDKVKTCAWMYWFNSMENLKSDILNAIYDINKFLPEVKLSFDGSGDPEQQLKSEPLLKWMIDPKFNRDNIDYVLRTYKKENLIFIQKKMDQFMLGINPDTPAIDIQLTEIIFLEDYDHFLNLDLKREFGCIFIKDLLSHKANQLFPSYIYDRVRNNKTNELQAYELA